MRTTYVVRAITHAAALVLPPALHAQMGGTPFRAGQWGAEFAASDDFESLGVVRFLSATRALAFNVRFSNTSSEIDGSQADPGDSSEAPKRYA